MAFILTRRRGVEDVSPWTAGGSQLAADMGFWIAYWMGPSIELRDEFETTYRIEKQRKSGLLESL
jgi:hypothetical protein